VTGQGVGEGGAETERGGDRAAGDPQREPPDAGQAFIAPPRGGVNVLSHAAVTSR